MSEPTIIMQGNGPLGFGSGGAVMLEVKAVGSGDAPVEAYMIAYVWRPILVTYGDEGEYTSNFLPTSAALRYSDVHTGNTTTHLTVIPRGILTVTVTLEKLDMLGDPVGVEAEVEVTIPEEVKLHQVFIRMLNDGTAVNVHGLPLDYVARPPGTCTFVNLTGVPIGYWHYYDPGPPVVDTDFQSICIQVTGPSAITGDSAPIDISADPDTPTVVTWPLALTQPDRALTIPPTFPAGEGNRWRFALRQAGEFGPDNSSWIISSAVASSTEFTATICYLLNSIPEESGVEETYGWAVYTKSRSMSSATYTAGTPNPSITLREFFAPFLGEGPLTP